MTERTKKLVEIWERSDNYFKEALERAISHRHVRLSELARFHLLLVALKAMRRGGYENLFGKGNQAIAEQLLNACSGEYPDGSRSETFITIGDSALIISGIWWRSLWRSAVNADYYIGIGAVSYKEASSKSEGDFSKLFEELSENFFDLALVLREATSQYYSDTDILRMYERWVEKHDATLERKLKELGIDPWLKPKNTR